MKLRHLCAAAALCVAGTANANSVIIDNGDGTVTDYLQRELMFLRDANYAGTTNYIDDTGLLSFAEALVWADDLVFAGHNDWRLPRSSERPFLAEDLGPFTPFTNVQQGYYWANDPLDASDPGFAIVFNAQTNVLMQSEKTGFQYAIAVRSEYDNIPAIPEPSTYALMLAGLAAVAWSVRRRLS